MQKEIGKLVRSLAIIGVLLSLLLLVIYGLTALTGLSGIILGTLAPWQAAVVGAQVVVLFLAVAAFEWKTRSATRS